MFGELMENILFTASLHRPELFQTRRKKDILHQLPEPEQGGFDHFLKNKPSRRNSSPLPDACRDSRIPSHAPVKMAGANRQRDQHREELSIESESSPPNCVRTSGSRRVPPRQK